MNERNSLFIVSFTFYKNKDFDFDDAGKNSLVMINSDYFKINRFNLYFVCLDKNV